MVADRPHSTIQQRFVVIAALSTERDEPARARWVAALYEWDLDALPLANWE